MKLHVLMALTTKKWVIGKNNKLPWHLPADLKRFKALTLGHPIIMGRKTYDSIGKPLPGRTNIVLSRNRDLKIEGCLTFLNLDEATGYCKNTLHADRAFVIGGAEILKQALPLADILNITWIDHEFQGDVVFPSFDFSAYKITHEEKHSEPFPFRFVDYARTSY